ncbi:MAG: M24 family metallopeptidase [Phycisphaerales bacterium]
MTRGQEMATKLERVRQLIRQQNMGGILLRARSNFAWLTGGGLSYINAASETGVGAMLVTAERVFLVSNNIETRRLIEEELGGLTVDLSEYPWAQGDGESRALARVLPTGKAMGVDIAFGGGGDGLLMGDAIRNLRTPMLPPEIERYRAHGKLTIQLTERVCRQIEPGMGEHDVAAMIHAAFTPHDVRVPVYLVAADDRIDTRRHPISKGRKIQDRVMVVVCAESHGLWTNLTRLVSFRLPDAQTKLKHRAVVQVDVTANAATKPGRTFGEIFADIVAEYDRQGFGEQWRLHHQGGSTGYDGRDVFATPTCPSVVSADQAFAWNPSITGTKSEDTMLVRADGIEWLTQAGADWPVVEIERGGVTYRRPDILVKA